MKIIVSLSKRGVGLVILVVVPPSLSPFFPLFPHLATSRAGRQPSPSRQPAGGGASAYLGPLFACVRASPPS